MDTKRNQTLEEIEENKIVNEHYQNRVMLIKKLLKTSRLATVDLLPLHKFHQLYESRHFHTCLHLSQAIYRKSPHSLYPRRKTAYKNIRPVSDFLK